MSAEKKIWLWIWIAFGALACRKEVVNVESPGNYPGNSFSQVFEAFWNGMNNNYVFWDIDTTNWDRMYSMYQPVFANLDINKEQDVKRSVGYFREMTSGLIDAHYRINFEGALQDSMVNPAYERKLRNGKFHQRYLFYDFDAGRYLDPGFVYGTDSSDDRSGGATEVVSGLIGGNILYFAANQFNLLTAYRAGDNGVKRALQYFMHHLTNPSAGLKGVIIDVRGNRGGEIDDLNFLMGNFVGERLTIGSIKYKNGNGRLDYTAWAPSVISPRPGARSMKIPVIGLIDSWSTSMAELTAMAIRTLPTGKIVGETSWGATGPLTRNETLNGGQFRAAGFMSVYTSSAIFRYVDGQIYEGRGFPPDFPVAFDENGFDRGKDLQLEKAISLIR